jgi:MtN3 and saliva related transmembrane protein
MSKARALSAPRTISFATWPHMSLDILGYIAASLTTAAFVPQAFRTIHSRNTRGISLWMYVIFTSGIALWFVYGLATRQWPVVVANAVTFPLAATILALKLRHG